MYITEWKRQTAHSDERLLCSVLLQQDDPRWVGAWWVGYLALMVAVLVAAPVFFGYPRHPDNGRSTPYFASSLAIVATDQSVNQ